jgi:hypothetical protein
VMNKLRSVNEELAFEEFVCYGIGNFASSAKSCYQFALFLLIKEELGKHIISWIYDPVLTESEKEFLVQNQCKLIPLNEEGKRVTLAKTLFFMPHNDKELYSNLLSANWGLDLQHLVILGNSFELYRDQLLTTDERQRAPYITKVANITEEYHIVEEFTKMREAFNDQSIMTFPLTRVKSLPPDFWGDIP